MSEKILWKDYGESSLTITSVLLFIEKENPTTPRDYGDFKRCLHLFECMGYDDFRTEIVIEQVAKKYPCWIPFWENWNKLMVLYYNKSKIKNHYYKVWSEERGDWVKSDRVRCSWNAELNELIYKLNRIKYEEVGK